MQWRGKTHARPEVSMVVHGPRAGRVDAAGVYSPSVLVGATYEARLRDLRRLRERFDALG